MSGQLRPEDYAWSRKRGDRLPAIAATCRRRSDTGWDAANLTGATGVRFLLRASSTPTDAPPDLAETATIVDAASGTVRYDLSGDFADLAPDEYLTEWEVEWPGPLTETFPNAGAGDLGRIWPDLGGLG